MKITEEELLFRKVTIVRCAFNLFCSRGIEEVTIEDISKKAGVGVTSVYRYFRTKLELLQKTHVLLWREIAKEFSSLPQTEGYQQKNGFQQLSCLVNGLEELLNFHQEYLLFSANCKLYLARQRPQLNESDYKRALAPISTLFLDSIRKGLLDRSIHSLEPPENVFSYLWNTISAIAENAAIQESIANQNKGGKEQFHMVCQLLLQNLLAEEAEQSNQNDTLYSPFEEKCKDHLK